jgi:acetyltransferase-like isoleucine patch superfamily enzyme
MMANIFAMLPRRLANAAGTAATILWAEFAEYYRALLQLIPGRSGNWLRRLLYGYRSAASARVLDNVCIYYPERLDLGERSAISAGSQLNAGGGIQIDDDVLIGPGCVIWSQNHLFRDPTRIISEQGYERKAVRIESDVWLAARVIVLPGVHVRRGTVAAAGAVITKSTEPFSIVAGVPAKTIGFRTGECAIANPAVNLPSMALDFSVQGHPGAETI